MGEFNRRSNPYISKVIDVSYYRKAIDSNDLLALDYRLHRVFNNPDTCNKLVRTNLLDLDANKDLKRVVLIDNEHNFKLDPNFQNVMIRILDNINTYELETKFLLRPSLAWFLITHKLLEDCPDDLLNNLKLEINTIYHFGEPLNFKTLIKVCGSRWKAEKGRGMITDIISEEFFNKGE